MSRTAIVVIALSLAAASAASAQTPSTKRDSAARATPLDNVIDVTIARLRRKVDDPFEKKLIHTIRGVGFVLGPEVR